MSEASRIITKITDKILNLCPGFKNQILKQNRIVAAL